MRVIDPKITSSFSWALFCGGFLRDLFRRLFGRCLVGLGARALHDRFVVRDPLLHGDAPQRVADHFEGQVFELLEPDAALAHVELLAGLGPSVAEPRFLGTLAIDRHHVERHVVLLRRQTCKRQRLLRVAVIACRIETMWHVIADHPVLHPLFVVLVDALQDHLSYGGDGDPAIFRQLGQILFDCRRLALHERPHWNSFGTPAHVSGFWSPLPPQTGGERARNSERARSDYTSRGGE